MNFLGHLILSGTNPDVIFGNFIADSVKGKSYLLLPDSIQKGIVLHRVIDNFTYKILSKKYIEIFNKL